MLGIETQGSGEGCSCGQMQGGRVEVHFRLPVGNGWSFVHRWVCVGRESVCFQVGHQSVVGDGFEENFLKTVGLLGYLQPRHRQLLSLALTGELA